MSLCSSRLCLWALKFEFHIIHICDSCSFFFDVFQIFKNVKTLTTGTYKGLKKLFKGIKGVEVHHIIEKRFKDLFKKCASTDMFMSVPLTKELHKTITQRWRQKYYVYADEKSNRKCISRYA